VFEKIAIFHGAACFREALKLILQLFEGGEGIFNTQFIKEKKISQIKFIFLLLSESKYYEAP